MEVIVCMSVSALLQHLFELAPFWEYQYQNLIPQTFFHAIIWDIVNAFPGSAVLWLCFDITLITEKIRMMVVCPSILGRGPSFMMHFA